jgi:hypothetical protein
MSQVFKKLGLASESPEAIILKLSDKVDNDKMNAYTLSEIVKTQKHTNDLQDIFEERMNLVSKAINELTDVVKSQKEIVPTKTLSEGRQVTLTLHANTIKFAAVNAVGATIERPVSNLLNGFYSPVSSGTYGVLFGIVFMGLTYGGKRGGGYLQALANGYFIGGVSQMIQDLFTFVGSKVSLP